MKNEYNWLYASMILAILYGLLAVFGIVLHWPSYFAAWSLTAFLVIQAGLFTTARVVRKRAGRKLF